MSWILNSIDANLAPKISTKNAYSMSSSQNMGEAFLPIYIIHFRLSDDFEAERANDNGSYEI